MAHLSDTDDSHFVPGRRRLLQGLAFVPALAIIGVRRVIAADMPTAIAGDTPRFQIIRPQDQLYVDVDAPGFELTRRLGSPALRRRNAEAYLRFRFPPQHFAESAVPIQILRNPTQLETHLQAAGLEASRYAQIVLRVPEKISTLRLRPVDLFAWHRYDLLLPDLQQLKLQLEKDGKTFFLGVDWAQELTSVIEMPWGVLLQPRGKMGQDFNWRVRRLERPTGSWNEPWSLVVENARDRVAAVAFELLDVRGVEYGDKPNARNVYVYSDADDYAAKIVEASPLTNFDRLELATTFSRRFPYDFSGPRLAYTPDSAQTCSPKPRPLLGCHVNGRAIEVTNYALTSGGGWLELLTRFDPGPGCAISGWLHSASFGRDQSVRVERKGYLYPFGIPAQLITLTERQFALDASGHYIAPLVKQAFIQIPQPNTCEPDGESPFSSLSVTTKQTPPLDPPASGNVSELATCDYFLPVVEGQPFAFALAGTDQDGTSHVWSQPLVFVSNAALNASGLIPEPGYEVPGSSPATPPPPEDCGFPTYTSAHRTVCYNFLEVTKKPRGGGLWALDILWSTWPHRFAQYDGKRIALAAYQEAGACTQQVQWIEWVRGRQPGLPDTTKVAPVPFRPRARLLKLSISSTQNFSGATPQILAAYRDLRFTTHPELDPEPTFAAAYDSNVFLPALPSNDVGAYLAALPLGEARPLPRDPAARARALNDPARLTRIRDAYCGNAGARLPLTLFADLDGEMRFGFASSSQASGGLTTLDSPIGLLTGRHGPVGDNLLDPSFRPATLPDGRMDYFAYRLKNRTDTLAAPFDSRPAQGSRARAALTSLSPLRNLAPASLFGIDAEIIPGIKLTDVLFGTSDAARMREAEGAPPQWNLRIDGLDELLGLIGTRPGQITLEEFTGLLQDLPVVQEPRTPFRFGVTATLDWSTAALKAGPPGDFITFRPDREATRTTLGISARASFDVLSKQATMSAAATLSDFALEIFSKSLIVEFHSLQFALSPAGHVSLQPSIASVHFANNLSFIQNLQDALSGLFNDLGIQVELDGASVRIGQDIGIPPVLPGEEPQPFYIGPASITNLTFRWGVVLPLIGREPLCVFFGLASREQPFVISVPPYGGKAYALIEITTTGIRLFEISMEYGGMLFARFSIARGEISLTAGFFFRRSNLGGQQNFDYEVFAKLCGQLDVARVIVFNGLIRVSLTYATGDLLTGKADVRVSAKIGIVRVSYGFTATRQEQLKSRKRSSGAQPPSAASVRTGSDTDAASANAGNFRPFADVTPQRWQTFVDTYAR